jgi:hypothetical protein
MSRIVIVILIYHHHNPIDLTYISGNIADLEKLAC